MPAMEKTKHVMIVDADASLQREVARILGAQGLQCQVAADAIIAKAFLARQHFDLLLSDTNLPGEAGIDLITWVKDRYPDTGIVMISADRLPETAWKAVQAGIFGYILKPLQKDQLVITVNNALHRTELEILERNRRIELERLVDERTAKLLQMQEQLRCREMELKTKKQRLAKADSALAALADYHQAEHWQIEEKVLANVKGGLYPYLQKLRRSGLTRRQTQLLDLLESGLQEIISPFIHTLSSTYIDLSPTELQVAHLIKEGRNTKEIATLLNLSVNTVMSHRFKIRSKLGIKNSHQNLHVFLKTLS
jgi:DNA-binding NarL/FixJ family response regulator